MTKRSADINDMPIAAHHLDPERIGEPDDENGDQWLEDWLDGDLVPGTRKDESCCYIGPVIRALDRGLDDTGLDHLSEMLRAYKSGHADKIPAHTVGFLEALEQEIRQDGIRANKREQNGNVRPN